MNPNIKVNLSTSFKRSIAKVILAIGLFFFSYLILIALSIGLLIACGYAGILIMSTKVNLFTLALGAGLIALGIMFFVFLIKFVFATHKDENSYRIQIFKDDHPELFKLIDDVSKTVGTKFPRKVFISYDVNACVFYNSSFWSLFFPVRRNLEIGLGLVNSLSVDEFKAIIAHEFGHFSQKSMRLGSYVYVVNNVIYNLVYNYDNWDKLLDKWSEAGGIFGFFALITDRVVGLVRFVLRKAYDLVNLPYMKLSREMEYHADEIAAMVAGKENMISALRRIEFTDIAFNNTVESLGGLANRKKISDNIYENHSKNIKHIGTYFKLQFENNLPVITSEDLAINTVKPRVIFKDQWATHPSREEREKHINNVVDNRISRNDDKSWCLFNNYLNVQQEMTRHLYSVNYGNLDEFDVINSLEFEEILETEDNKYKISEIYNDFYKSRALIPIELDELLEKTYNVDINSEFNSVFSKESGLKFEKIQYDQNDLIVLNQIKNKEIKTKYFEFDNKKYNRRDVDNVISLLESEIEDLKSELKTLEEKAFLLTVNVSEKISTEVKDEYIRRYRSILDYQNNMCKYREYIEAINNYQYTIYSKTRWQENELNQFNRDLSKFEEDYKNNIKCLFHNELDEIPEYTNNLLKDYFNNTTFCIMTSSFNIDGFNRLVQIVYEFQAILNDKFILKLKDLTDFQLGLFNKLELCPEKDDKRQYQKHLSLI